MNKYLKALLIFFFFWAIVGTLFAVVLSIVNASVWGSVLGFVLGVFQAYKIIKK